MFYESTLNTLKELIQNNRYDVAVSFYEKVVFPELIEMFKIKNKNIRKIFGKRVGILVLSVGKSWVPIALSILYFQPIFVIPIVTKESEEYFNKAEYMIHKFADFTYETRKVRIKSTDIEGINLALKDVITNLYELFKRTTEKDKLYISSKSIKDKIVKIIFDITGGKKTMALGLGFLATNLKYIMRHADLKIVYIDSQEDKNYKKIGVSLPGSERLILVNVPSTIILKELYVVIEELFKSYSYSEISNLIEKYLSEIVDKEEKKALKITREIAKAYDEWMKNGEYTRVTRILLRINKDIKSSIGVKNDFLYSIAETIEENIQVLGKILEFLRTNKYETEGAYVTAIDLFMRAIRLEKIGETIKTIILYQQAIELALKHLLAKKYKLNPLKPRYKKLEKNTGKPVINKFKDLYKEIFNYPKNPPQKIVYTYDLIILLKALESNTTKTIDKNTINKLATVTVKILTFSTATTITPQTLKWLKNITLNIIKQVGNETAEHKLLHQATRNLTYPLEKTR